MSIVGVDAKIRAVFDEIVVVDVAANWLACRIGSERDVDAHVVTIHYTFFSLN